MFRLTLQYLLHHRAKTAVLILGLALVLLLPLVLQTLLNKYEQELSARAQATPLVAGVRGDRYDLALNALYFATTSPGEIPWSELQRIREQDRGSALPIHARHTAEGAPVVGTSIDYFARRNLATAAGTLPLRVGDCVLGADAAHQIQLGVGERIDSDQNSLFDLTQYPLTMRIVGILAPSGGPDDGAIFTDVKTTWILDGLGHGHDDLSQTNQSANLIKRDEKTIVASAAVTKHMEITEANLASFHLHGALDTLPLTAVLVFPASEQDATILTARYNQSKLFQMLDAPQVISELLALVLRVKAWFQTIFLIFLIAILLFLGLIVMQSLRLRQREQETLFLLGCSRGKQLAMLVMEWGILLIAAIFLAGIFTLILLAIAPDVGQWLSSS